MCASVLSNYGKDWNLCIKTVGFDKIIYQICTNREIYQELGNPIEKWMPS